MELLLLLAAVVYATVRRFGRAARPISGRVRSSARQRIAPDPAIRLWWPEVEEPVPIRLATAQAHPVMT